VLECLDRASELCASWECLSNLMLKGGQTTTANSTFFTNKFGEEFFVPSRKIEMFDASDVWITYGSTRTSVHCNLCLTVRNNFMNGMANGTGITGEACEIWLKRGTRQITDDECYACNSGGSGGGDRQNGADCGKCSYGENGT